MYLSESIQNKWAPVLDHADMPSIKDPYRRAVTAVILENQEKALKEEAGILNETLPPNSAGTGGYGSGAYAGGPVAGFDPILISLVRRSLPNLMAYDVCGVQPMTGPTGLIFAMRSVYAGANSSLNVYTEALFNEANTAYSGAGTFTAFTSAANANLSISGGQSNSSIFGLANTGYGFTNAQGEDLGGAYTMNQMGFSIEKVTVTANTRGLQAAYTIELAQDLKAVHGLDAETELANILSTEILAEINREVVRTIYATAVPGAQYSNVPGLFNLAVTGGDTAGRWQVETYKSLIFQIEREANKIAKDTRRGKGNMIICSTDVASALAMSGLLDYQSALTNNTNLTVDDTGNTFAGTLFGRVKVYVDPYSVAGADYVVTGYKGSVAYDAGLFYCPYVPLQMVRAIDPNTYQPKIGFKTRYGIVANPFAQGTTQGLGALTNNTNVYYRKFIVANLK
jgi:Major capsid protein Gp23